MLADPCLSSCTPCRGAYLLAVRRVVKNARARIEETPHLRLARGVLHYECNEVFTASGSEYQNKVKNALARIEKNPPLRGRIEKNSPCGE